LVAGLATAGLGGLSRFYECIHGIGVKFDLGKPNGFSLTGDGKISACVGPDQCLLRGSLNPAPIAMHFGIRAFVDLASPIVDHRGGRSDLIRSNSFAEFAQCAGRGGAG